MAKQNSETNAQAKTSVRLAVLDDAPAIFSIFKQTNPTETTNRHNGIGLVDVIDWIEIVTEQQPLFILEQDDELKAWCSLAPFYGLPAFAKTLEISLYVIPESQQKGLGKQLIQHIETQQQTIGFTHLIAYIYGSNLNSLRFFKKQEFEQWGFLPNVAESEGNREDVVLLGRSF